MKAGIFFTGTGPILILTSYESLDDPNLVEKLAHKGIKKYIAFEIQEDLVKERYGKHFNVILGDLKQEDDLRVLGTNKEDMSRAVNRVIRFKGGLAVVVENEVTGLELPLAGLMSSKPAHWVRDKLITAARKLTEIGCGLDSPFMTISFLALPVIPALKLSDKGLFDVKKFKFVDVVKSDNE